MPRKFPFTWCFLFVKILALNYTNLCPNVWQNGSSDQPFPIIFSKKTMYMFRRWSFSITLKELLKNSNPLQSYGQNSNLSPSKPPYVHWGGANSSINTVYSYRAGSYSGANIAGLTTKKTFFFRRSKSAYLPCTICCHKTVK